jgi:hypothetical protein
MNTADYLTPVDVFMRQQETIDRMTAEHDAFDREREAEQKYVNHGPTPRLRPGQSYT